MRTTSRRHLLATAAGAAAAAALADAGSAVAQAQPKPIFAVPATIIPIVGQSDVFQVRRIYCIGRNYAAHAIERGSDPTREPPFFFQKPTDAIQKSQSARSPIILIRPLRRTITTRSNSSRP